MKGNNKFYTVMLFIIFLSACGQEAVNVKPVDTVPITSEEKARLAKEKEKNRLRLNKQLLNQNDILSKDFKDNIVKQGAGETTHLYEGIRFEEIERELGKYKVKELGDKGHLVKFDTAPNIEILFSRNIGAVPDKNANIKRVYFKKYSGEGNTEEIIKVWGKPKYKAEWPNNLKEYYYEFNNPHPQFIIIQLRANKLLSVSNLSKHSYTERLQESYSITDPNIILDVLQDNVVEGLLNNRLNWNGIKVGDKVNESDGNKKIGEYELVVEDKKVIKISMDMSNVVHDDIKDVRSKLGSDYEVRKEGNKEITVYKGKDDNIVTEIVSYENGKLVEIANVSDDYQPNNERLKVTESDPNIIEKNGTAHYKITDTLEFEEAFGKKQFKILGIKTGEDAGDLIEKLGEPVEEKVGRSSSNTYVYDNFEVSIKDGKVYCYLLDIKSEKIQAKDLEERWNEQPKAKTNHHMRFNKNKDDDYYSEIQFDENGIVENVAVYGDEFVGD